MAKLLRSSILCNLIILMAGLVFHGQLLAAPCLTVTLTGTQGGPPVFNGQAGAGTLVQYGDDLSLIHI